MSEMTNMRSVLLVGDTILDPLGRLLERCQQTPRLLASAAPYGQIYQILLDPSHPAWSVKPEILLVWTTPQLTLPSVAKLLRFEFESAAAAKVAGNKALKELLERILQEKDETAD